MRDFLLRRTNSLFSNADPELDAVKDTLIDSINEMDISLVYFALSIPETV